MIDQMDVRTKTRNTVSMPSRAWYGDEEITLSFPEEWELHVLAPHDAPKASPAEIEAAFANPIGSARIRELAQGKKSAAIVVDDVSRPTPAAELIPYALAELAAAGIPKSQIRFVIGGGSHRPQTTEEIHKKVGADIAAEYFVKSHDFMAGDLRGIGSLPDGTPLYFDPIVVEAEFKMTIGGIYPHGAVGFGGGSKLILPGVAGFATMFNFHTFYPGRGQGVIERTGDVPDHRDISEAAARMLGLDVVVNSVINGHREIAAVFVGDFVQAQRTGARFALRTYGTEIPETLRREANLVVANAYPLDSDPIQITKALWGVKHFDNVYTAVVDPAVDGICYHGLFDRIGWHRFEQQLATRAAIADPAPRLGAREEVLVWSENFPAHDFPRKMPNGILFRDWDVMVEKLAAELPQRAKVAIFPVSGLQVLAVDS